MVVVEDEDQKEEITTVYVLDYDEEFKKAFKMDAMEVGEKTELKGLMEDIKVVQGRCVQALIDLTLATDVIIQKYTKDSKGSETKAVYLAVLEYAFHSKSVRIPAKTV